MTVADAAVSPAASVVLVTRNRREELRVALLSAMSQEGSPEVLVIDDASTDGTPDMVQRDFPRVRLHRSPVPVGYIGHRNRAATLASASIVVSIDDDACFSSEDAVATTVAEFSDPRIGVVAMPLIHTARGPDVLQRAPSADGVWVTNAYIGTAHAVRRDLFLALGGYREELVYGLEEPDFCVRLLRSGHVVRLGRAAPILHHESSVRDHASNVRHLCRNHLVFTYQHVPLPYNLSRLAGLIGYALWFGARVRRPAAAVRGLLAGVMYVARHRSERAPLALADYRLWRTLRRRPQLIEEVVASRSR